MEGRRVIGLNRAARTAAVAATAAIISMTAPANAASTTYNMFDHPDGAKSATYDYGLRLDRENPDMFFSAEDGSGNSILQLEYTAPTPNGSDAMFTLSGQVRLNGYAGAWNNTLWDVVYSMSGVTDHGNGIFVAGANSTMGADSLTCASAACGTASYTIGRKARASDTVFFALGIPGDDPGNIVRGGVLTATGWADGAGTNDWLLTGQVAVAPLPAGVLFLLTGLAGLGFVARRRARA